jgi:hypothetical protein
MLTGTRKRGRGAVMQWDNNNDNDDDDDDDNNNNNNNNNNNIQRCSRIGTGTDTGLLPMW